MKWEYLDEVILCRLLTVAFNRTDKLTEALKYADHGLEIAPDHYMLLYHRAKVYYRLQKYEQAIADLELALATVVNEDVRQEIRELRKDCLQSQSTPGVN